MLSCVERKASASDQEAEETGEDWGGATGGAGTDETDGTNGTDGTGWTDAAEDTEGRDREDSSGGVTLSAGLRGGRAGRGLT